MMDRIPPIPRARLLDERYLELRGELREPGVERRGTRVDLVLSQPTVGKTDAHERAIETRMDRTRVLHRHQRECDLLTTRPKPSQSETNPLQDLLNRRFVEQIVANIREQRAGWQPLRVFPFFPKPTLRDPRQHTAADIAQRAIRSSVTQRSVNIQRTSAQVVQETQDLAKSQRHVTRPEQDYLFPRRGN